MYNTFLLTAALIAALVFAQPAPAQHGHGGHGHGHGGHSYGHSYGHGYSHAGHYGHSALGQVLSGHNHGYHPSITYGYYSQPYYSYSPPAYYTYPSANYQYYPPTSRTPIVDQASSNQAQIQVVLPNPDAEVTFDGAKTTSVGRVRLYHTPVLDLSSSNSYRIGASWMQDGRPITDARVVTVTAGRTVVVDFTQPTSESVPMPTKSK